MSFAVDIGGLMPLGENSCLLLNKPLDGWIRVARVISASDVDVLDAHARAIPVGWDLAVSWLEDADHTGGTCVISCLSSTRIKASALCEHGFSQGEKTRPREVQV